MVREVVVDRHAAGLADDLETPLDAQKTLQAVADGRVVEPYGAADGNRRQGVPDVVTAEERQAKAAEVLLAVPHRERWMPSAACRS